MPISLLLRRLTFSLCFLHLLIPLREAYAQNLVPNPGFELYKERPCHRPTSSTGAFENKNIRRYVMDWYTPTLGTSDILYSDTSDVCDASLSRLGVNTMYDGKMCAGIYLSEFNHLANNSFSKDKRVEYREYLQVRLSSNLTIGKVYRLEFFVRGIIPTGLLSNNMGALFSTDSVLRRNSFGERIEAIPQIVERSVLGNKAEWQKVSGCFVADSAYRFLTIGNFLSDFETSYQKTEWNVSLGPYYLVDGISVVETDISAMPPIDFLGSDTTICQGKSIEITSDRYRPWVFEHRNGTTSTSLSIDQAGTYTANLSYAGCVITDTIHIKIIPPVDIGRDTLICDSGIFELKSNIPVIWPDGSLGMQFIVKASGQYRVESVSNVCPSSATVKIELANCPGEIPNTFSPNGDGKNDYFIIPNMHTGLWELQVFNRWGDRVYLNKVYDNSWDGGKLPSGQYFYRLSSASLRKDYKGWVVILR
ncbi:gliding motility-associated C-terminal domain-containing protein [Ravibacter arvi]|uniref:gliding motility-associated C-terminal domain-containing protein n=1 Tax=Ravibacter arvi TaxID=2051041 RepID=UPI0031EC658A